MPPLCFAYTRTTEERRIPGWDRFMMEKKTQNPRIPSKPPRRGLLSVLSVLVRSFLLLWVSFSINILNFVTYITVRPWSRGLARRVTGEWMQTLWFEASSWLLPTTDLIISGEEPKAGGGGSARPAIIIANHQVDADWWYCWEFARAYKLHGRLKIILKADLRNIPIMGWGMRQFEFLFLDRKWEADRQRLYSLLGSFVDDKYRAVMLIYPEGTTINTKTLDKCRAFAAKRQRPLLKHLLLPRTTGFAACLDALSSAGETPIIYDLTIAYSGYSGEVPTWEMGYNRERDLDVPNVADMFRGRTCRAVHVHVKQYDGNKAVLGDAEHFLDERWREKDALLDRFIHTQSFVAAAEAPAAASAPPPPSSSPSSSTPTTTTSTIQVIKKNKEEGQLHQQQISAAKAAVKQEGSSPAAAAAPLSLPVAATVLSPHGSLPYFLLLLAFPTVFFLLLPVLSLVFLLFSPALVLAGTIQVLSAVLNPPSSKAPPLTPPSYDGHPPYSRFAGGTSNALEHVRESAFSPPN